MKTVKKSFDILKLLSDAPENLHSSALIADTLGIKRPTCSILLKSLVEIGAVEQPSPRGGYRLGYMPYHLARNGPFKKDLKMAAGKHLQKFAEQTGEAILLSIFHGNKRIILDIVESTHPVNVRRDSLFLEDFYSTASGKILISFLEPAEQDNFIAKYGLPSSATWKEASTKKGFASAIAEIHREKLAVSFNHDKSFVQLAVPVFDHRKRCVAALSVPVPAFRYKKPHGNKVIGCLKETAEKISSELINRS